MRTRSTFLEGDLNPAYISAFAGLAGAIIGGLTSFATTWLTQRAQLLSAHREAEKAKLEALYTDFIAEAARLLGEALTHQTDDVAPLMRIYSMVGRMRLVSDRAVVDAAGGSRTRSPRPTSGQTAPFARRWNTPTRVG